MDNTENEKLVDSELNSELNPEEVPPPPDNFPEQIEYHTRQSNETRKTDISFSLTSKIFIIGTLACVLFIPTMIAESYISERKSRRDKVVKEISEKWGSSQILKGPVIILPYKLTPESGSSISQFVILPEKLDIGGNLETVVRYRSLFQAVLYNAKINMEGNFIIPDLNELGIDDKLVMWDKAFISIGISDLRGIRESVIFNVDSVQIKANPGISHKAIEGKGISGQLNPLKAGQTVNFSFDLDLNGSEELQFTPVGRTTVLKLASAWPSPSFNGEFLPVSRKITDKGFNAQWKVLHLNRDFPQFWRKGENSFKNSAFGLKLKLTADIYQKNMRITKYAIIFLFFTFAAFFFAEIFYRRRFHPIQYFLVGTAIVIFYSLLLSFSEHITFNIAYIISAGIITILISVYSALITQSLKFPITIGGILLTLYSYLFVILQMSDYALLTGSIGILIVLALVMVMTRHIDWYNLEKVTPKK